MEISEILKLLISGCNLSSDQMRSVFEGLMGGELSDVQISAFLMGLNCKGVTSEELAAAADVMRSKVRKIPITVDAVDNCGTGGDGISTFNVSTTAAIIAAGAGAYVAKHGNRSNTRRSGSAEVLAALGVNIEADIEAVAKSIELAHIGFCFAIKLHPAMKYAAPVRKALGVPTIFNMLGPLTNPAGVKRQVIGVPKDDMTELLAWALKYLGAERAMIVHGLDGLCDISISEPTKISELCEDVVTTYIITPDEFDIEPVSLEELLIDSPEESARIIEEVLSGRRCAARDIAAINASSVLVVAGIAKDLRDGLELSYDSIDSGKAKAALDKMIEITNG